MNTYLTPFFSWLKLISWCFSFSILITACQPSVNHAIKTDSLTVALTLEPSSLDPTINADAAIGEIVLYNVFETLTKLQSDNTITPLLATNWHSNANYTRYDFTLIKHATFHNKVPVTAASVKYSFERAAKIASNKDKDIFTNMSSIDIKDNYHFTINLKTPEPNLPELLTQASAIIVEPSSADTNKQHPIGSGPYKFIHWHKGNSIDLAKFADYYNADKVKINQIKLRFIVDGASAINALKAHDIDVYYRGLSPQNAPIFAHDERYNLLVGNSASKTILAMNHQRSPLNNIKVRQAISMAIDKQQLIDNVAYGYAVPIGSHYAPSIAGYIDTTYLNPFNLKQAKQLLKESAIALPLNLTLKLPPTFYARQNGELIRAQLQQLNINVKIEFIEWATWLNEVYSKHNYDLTIISHVEPFDLQKPASPGYYFGYHSVQFDNLFKQSKQASTPELRLQALHQAQILLAKDAVSVYLYSPQWLSVAHKKLRGVTTHHPFFVTNLADIYWQP